MQSWKRLWCYNYPFYSKYTTQITSHLVSDFFFVIKSLQETASLILYKMKKAKIMIIIFATITIFVMCNKPDPLPDNQFDNRLNGGLATTFDATSQAFTHSIDGLSGMDGFVH